MQDEIKVLELFGGIGACTQAFRRLNIPHTVVDYVEIDEYATQAYNLLNDTNFEPQDVSEWNKDIDVDFIMHGSPCTNFSLAGKQEGGDEGSGTPSSLMYETIRLVQKLNPKYVVWENVANLLSDKHIHNFNNYIEALRKFGYYNYYKVVNSKDCGIPQNRERVFTVSIRKDIKKLYKFPYVQVLKSAYTDYLESDYDKDTVLTQKELGMMKDFGADYSFGGFIVKGNIYPTITASYGKVSGNSGKIKCKEGYRILTARECWRLMGFGDLNFERVVNIIPKSQLYKQAGNSIVVDVLENILANLFDIKQDKDFIKQLQLF